jgi:hypothetical protein
MNTFQINPEKKQEVKSDYSDLCNNLNSLYKGIKEFLPDADEHTVIDLILNSGRHEHKALTFLNRLYAAENLPAGLNIDRAIESKIFDLPDWKPTLYAWGNCTGWVNQLLTGYYRIRFYFPLRKLFDKEQNIFRISDAFLKDLDEYFTVNVQKPENMELIDQLIGLLNKLIDAGAWDSVKSRDQIFELSEILLAENGKFKFNHSATNSRIFQNILDTSRNKLKYPAESLLAK